MASSRGPWVRALLAAAWAGALACGTVSLWRYAGFAGEPGDAPRRWPAQAGGRRAGAATLVMLVHPKCPCSRASIDELRVLLARAGGRVEARVFFYHPPGEGTQWARTGLWRTAAGIPGVAVEADPDGATARRFGARTSGQVVLYDSTGALVFAGGITGARGHAGDNPGLRAAVDALLASGPAASAAPVFGCPLRGRKEKRS